MKPRKYQFNNSTLTIIFGDITTSEAEVIASSDDTGISMGGGISGCIRRAGGESIREDAQKKLPAQLGDVVVSTAGAMKHQKFIFHCLTIKKEETNDFYYKKITNPEDVNNYILQHSVDKCFRLLQALDLNSIAFPCIGAGAAHIPLDKVAEVMADAIASNLCKTQRAYQIELYLFDRHNTMTEMDYIDMFEKFAIKAALSRYIAQNLEKPATSAPAPALQPINIPKRNEMSHLVFISYSRKDKERVDEIRAVLDEHDIPYWIDKEGIFSGENYKEVIVDAIETAKALLFVSSANSNASINVVRELGYAVLTRKTIIPVLLDDTPYAKSIRLDIADIDQISFNNDEVTKKKLVASLAYALGLKD